MRRLITSPPRLRLTPDADAATSSAAAMRSGEDPVLDIHDLFVHYNSLYFRDSLAACFVRWTSSPMASYAGTCEYLAGGACEIQLSGSLLKCRSTAVLKNTLLHEMIHAYLWFSDKNNNHSEHGPVFEAIMRSINSSRVNDHQRPSGGYNVTIYHEFHEKDHINGVQEWHCQSCGDLIKRAVDRKPSSSDCIMNLGRAKSCGNSSCYWHNHKMSCSGSYTKREELPGYKDKKKVTKDAQEKEVYLNKQVTKRLRVDDTEDDSNAKLSDIEKAAYFHAPKRPRSYVERKKPVCNHIERSQNRTHTDQYKVVSLWLGLYEDAETDDDIKPLINKRTVRREKLKLLKAKGKGPKFMETHNSFPAQESITFGDDEGHRYNTLACNKNSMRKNHKMLGDCPQTASPINSLARDDIIDISDGE